MRIGIMCHSTCSGSARIAVASAKELAERGHRVNLFTRTLPYFLWKAHHGIHCHTLSDDNGATQPAQLQINWSKQECDAMAELLISVLQDKGLDILHIHYALPFVFIVERIWGAHAKELPPVILTLHGSDVSVFSTDPIWGTKLARALKNFNIVTTVSRNHARLSTQLLHLKHEPEVIPNFVSLDDFGPKQAGCPRLTPKIVHISNFRQIKDPCGVVEIFAMIRKRIKAQLWLVGEGEEMGKVRTLVEQNNLMRDVRFFGMRPDVSTVLAESDLLLMNSKSESFCLATLEAMAHGVPVLAPWVGGIPEVVRHGNTGYLFSLGNYSEASELAIRLLSAPDRYRRMSENAFIHARQFDQKRIVSRYENLYSRVVEGNAGTYSISEMPGIVGEAHNDV